MALLQRRSADCGLFPVSDEQRELMTDAVAWFHTLNLDDAAVKYAKDLARPLDASTQGSAEERALESACMRFTQGFEGINDMVRAATLMDRQSGMTGGARASAREKAIYESSPEFLESVALDHLIVNLSGVIDPSQRFSDEGMPLNGDVVRDAMRRETDRLCTRLASAEAAALNRAGRRHSELSSSLLAAYDAQNARAALGTTMKLSLPGPGVTRRQKVRRRPLLRQQKGLRNLPR